MVRGASHKKIKKGELKREINLTSLIFFKAASSRSSFAFGCGGKLFSNEQIIIKIDVDELQKSCGNSRSNPVTGI